MLNKTREVWILLGVCTSSDFSLHMKGLLLSVCGCQSSDTSQQHCISVLKVTLSSVPPCNWHLNSATAQLCLGLSYKLEGATASSKSPLSSPSGELSSNEFLFNLTVYKGHQEGQFHAFMWRLQPMLLSPVPQLAASVGSGGCYTYLGREFLCWALASCLGFLSGEEEMQSCPVTNFVY